jgi:hypothetical protein
VLRPVAARTQRAEVVLEILRQLGPAARRSNASMRPSRPRGRGSSTAARTGYFLACSKYGLVPEAWSVTSTTRSISETVWVIATSMPWLRVTVAMPQP